MDRNKVLEKLIRICNILDNTTVTGLQNMSNITGCYTIVQEVIQMLLSFDNDTGEESGVGPGNEDKKR